MRAELAITTDAQYVLFVEKDATFQRLLDENVFDALGPVILITGTSMNYQKIKNIILNYLSGLKFFNVD